MSDIIKEYLKKNGPAFGVVSAIGGFVTDVLAPLANFAFYLLVASAAGLAATWLYYKFADRDNHVSKKEAAFTRIVFFGFFTLIWGVLAFVHVIGPDKGVVASSVPGVETLQESLGIISQDVKDIKADTELILAELQAIKGDLANAQNGSISSSPNTAVDWYTNAILYASQGQSKESVEAYQEFFSYGYPYNDAYLTFNTIARNELSQKELNNFYADHSQEHPGNVIAQLMNSSTEKDTDKRRKEYDQIRDLYGDTSILLFWLINEYSVAGTYAYANELDSDEVQQWTTSDQATLREILLDYENLPPTDDISTYFISSFSADGARTMINALGNQFEDDQANAMLDNPIILVTNPTQNGDEKRLSFVIYDSYTDIFWRVPGYVDEFTSTIPTDWEPSGPWGGEPDPELEASVNVPAGNHTVEVYWVNQNGKNSDVYTFTDAYFMSLQEFLESDADGPIWIYPDGSSLN